MSNIRELEMVLPGLPSLLVLDAASFARVIESRPEVWVIIAAFLRYLREHGEREPAE